MRMSTGNAKYRLVEIVDFKESADEYVVERLKTNIRIGVRESNKIDYVKMILVSNSNPN